MGDLEQAVVEKIRDQSGAEATTTVWILLEDRSESFHHADEHLVLALCVRFNNFS